MLVGLFLDSMRILWVIGRSGRDCLGLGLREPVYSWPR